MFNVKKGFLKFISFRLLAILFTLIFFQKFKEGFQMLDILLVLYDNDYHVVT